MQGSLTMLLISLFVITSACSEKTPQNRKLDPKIQIINAAQGDELFNQCSRGVPPHGERYFKPDVAQIEAFETLLQAELDANAAFQGEIEWRKSQKLKVRRSIAEDWARDIIGFERGGGKYLYGNYYPADENYSKERNGPVIICDGGPAYFGAEFDVTSGKISHLDFNGTI